MTCLGRIERARRSSGKHFLRGTGLEMVTFWRPKGEGEDVVRAVEMEKGDGVEGLARSCESRIVGIG